jgi:tetratricopeptide (TPR) repeat protein
VSQRRLLDILSAIAGADARRIDQATASAVAARANVKWVVTGKVYQISPKVILSAEVSDAGNGDVVTTQKITGNDGEDLFAVVDKLGASLRNNLALPEAAKTEVSKSVAEVTTHSADAYRYYLKGVEYGRKIYEKEAIASYLKAVEHDSTYAMAWYQLSQQSDQLAAISPEQRRIWLAKAEQYSSQATWKEQRYIHAASLFDKQETRAALEQFREILTRYPDDIEALRSLAAGSRNLGNISDAVGYLERVLAVDSLDRTALNDLAYNYNDLGNLEKSLWAINRYIALSPDEANPYDSRGDIYALNGKAREAIESYRMALQRNPDFPTHERLGLMYVYVGEYERADSVFRSMAANPDPQVRAIGRGRLHSVAFYKGQFRRALAELTDAIGADRMEGNESILSIRKLFGQARLLDITGRTDEALNLAKEISERLVRFDSTDVRYGRDEIAYFQARSGDSKGAHKTIEELRKDILALKDTTGWTLFIAGMDGDLAAAEGRLDDAIAHYEQIDFRLRGVLSSYHMAKGWIESNKLEKAVSELEHRLSYLDGELVRYPYHGVRCIYLLGVAYEQSGWKDKAAEQYKRFLDIWKDADPGIEEVADARARLAKLAS